MKNLLACLLLLSACTKVDVTANNPTTAGTITAVINKTTLNDSVQVLLNEACSNCDTTQRYTGTIQWGDGNTYTFSKHWNESVFQTHTYAAAAIYTVNVNLNRAETTTSFTIDIAPDQVMSLSGLSVVPISYLVLQDDKLPALDISGNPLLQQVFLGGNTLTNFSIASNTALKLVQLQNNNLPTSSVNAILVSLDNAGLHNGSVNLSHQSPSAPPSGAGVTAVSSLIAKGWTVQTD
jgi:hypothetical protein